MGPQPSDLHIILVRPQEEGNVGATARAMANMGLDRLVVVEPGAPFGPTARAFAVGAGHVLDRARRTGSLSEALAPFRRTVGTTSTRDRRIGPAVPLLLPEELPTALDADPPGTPTALVFGPESSGLTAEELARLSPLVRVPCSPAQPTLNLSQAVLILTYELHMSRLTRRARLRGAVRSPGESRSGDRSPKRPLGAPGAAPSSPEDLPAPAVQVDGLFGHARQVLERVGFDRDDTFEAVMRDLRRLAGRAGLTGREVTILRGICRRTLNALDRQGESSAE